MERYSMGEFKPMTLEDKRMRIESEINDLNDKKQPLVERKQELEVELSELNNTVRGNVLEKGEYQAICKRQSFIKAEKMGIERQIMGLKDAVKKKHQERDSIGLQLKRIPDGAAKAKCIEIRDQYMSFASDMTRVSSMRAMASKFVEEMQELLKVMR